MFAVQYQLFIQMPIRPTALLAPIFLCMIFLRVQAQHDWQVPLQEPQVFIENLGQYDALGRGFPARPRYVIDHGFGWQAMVTDDGLQYLVQRTIDDESADNEEAHGPEESHGEIVQSRLSMQFVGASPTRTMRAAGEQDDYYTYSYPVGEGYRNVDHAAAYSDLHIDGLYPGIGLDLAGPKDGGLKYSFQLQPRANAGAIRLKWEGGTPTLDGNGDLHLPAVLGELVDQHPSAWYTDDPSTRIPVEFALSGQQVTFMLGNYDAQRAITIDPWTINPALPAPFNRAFEVDYDAAGNVYVFGGGMGYNLKKYNSAGTLQWTHTSPWDTSNAWFGELLTLSTGDCFITSGSVAKIRRLTTGGGTTFTNNGPFFNNDEYWNLTLSCDLTKLVAGGTRLIGLVSPQGHIFNLNMANGNQQAGSPYNVSPVGMKEIRALCTAGNGNYYMLSNDNLIAVNQAFGIIYSIASGTSHPYNSPAFLAKNVQGQNSIDANSANIYINTGSNLQKRDINTGALLSSIAIPGGGFTGGFFGTGATNSGMVIDACNNVFVGSTNAIYKYDANLNLLGSVVTTGAIYDLVIPSAGTLIAGGNALVISNTTLAPCAPKTIVCVILPVEMGYFNANCHSDIVEVHWQSLQENNNLAYFIERTQDGVQWEERGRMAGAGTSASPIDYQFREATPLPHADQPWYYRLKMTDGDGNETYSGITTVETCAQSDPTISVNPTVADKAASLSFESKLPGNGRLLIDQALGQTVRSVDAHWLAGQNALQLPIETLPAGIYHVRVIDAKGEVIVRNARFVKQ